MLVNFGLRETFDTRYGYLIPTGRTILSQWDVIDRDRYGHHRDIIGNYTNKYKDVFFRNYVEPLSAINSNSSDAYCRCNDIGFVAINGDKLTPKVLNLNAIFELSLKTNVLPVISPVFRKRVGVNLQNVSEEFQKCGFCGNQFSSVAMTASGATETTIGLHALARAPRSSFALGFFSVGVRRALYNLGRANNIPKQVTSFGIRRFARLLIDADITTPLKMRKDVELEYGFKHNNFAMKDPVDTVVLVLLKAISYQEDIPGLRPSEINIFKDRNMLIRLAKLAAYSSSLVKVDEISWRSTQKEVIEVPYDFSVLVQSVLHDIDLDLLDSAY